MEREKENVKNLSWKIHFWQTVEEWLFLTDLGQNSNYYVIILTRNFIGHISFPYSRLCRYNVQSAKLIRYKTNKSNTWPLSLRTLKSRRLLSIHIKVYRKNNHTDHGEQ